MGELASGGDPAPRTRLGRSLALPRQAGRLHHNGGSGGASPFRSRVATAWFDAFFASPYHHATLCAAARGGGLVVAGCEVGDVPGVAAAVGPARACLRLSATFMGTWRR